MPEKHPQEQLKYNRSIPHQIAAHEAKIALFLPSLMGGGAEKVFVTLANSLVNHDYSVDFVLSSAIGDHLSALDSRVSIFDLKQRRTLISFWGLAKYLHDQKPNILLSGLSNANTAALLATCLAHSSCKVIITQHANWSQVLLNNPPRMEFVLFFLSKYLYPQATKIIAVSRDIGIELAQMRNIKPLQIETIYNPVVTHQMIDLSKQKPNHRWFLEKKEPILIGVGRLVEQKDFETLIRAFHKVQQKIACKLLILGEGSERLKLESLVKQLGLSERVEMPGFAQNPYAFISNADLFVLSSLFEGLPTVLIEAMACGTPVVATNCISGPNEILDNGKYGTLVPIRDVDMLANAIIDSLLHPRSKETPRERAQLFSVENATEAYIRVFNQVLSSQ